jgi:hypothetical protein
VARKLSAKSAWRTCAKGSLGEAPHFGAALRASAPWGASPPRPPPFAPAGIQNPKGKPLRLGARKEKPAGRALSVQRAKSGWPVMRIWPDKSGWPPKILLKGRAQSRGARRQRSFGSHARRAGSLGAGGAKAAAAPFRGAGRLVPAGRGGSSARSAAALSAPGKTKRRRGGRIYAAEGALEGGGLPAGRLGALGGSGWGPFAGRKNPAPQPP